MKFSEWLKQQTTPAQATAKKTTFSIEDFKGVRDGIFHYLDTISTWSSNVGHWLLRKYPETNRQVISLFQTEVEPHYSNLVIWGKWIEEMIQQRRLQKNEWILTEAIKISYKAFENLKSAMQNLTQAMTKWVDAIAYHLPSLLGEKLKTHYYHNVQNRYGELARRFTWLHQKIQELMGIHGKAYSGIPQKSQ
jgi:hypothetical protein